MDQSSPWGMVVHSTSEWDISELHKGGVAFMRIDFRWDALQPNNGSEPFAWLHFDRIVRWAVARGVWILAGLGGTPRWAVDANRMNADGNRYRPDAYPPANLALWDDYVSKVVTRYSARGVRYWGIWNEPDSRNESNPGVVFWRGSQPEFLSGVFDRAMNIFRTMPDLRVCVPDLAKSDDPGPWLNPILARAGRNIFAVTAHVYRGSGDGSDVRDRAAVTRRIVDSYNTANGTQIQLWITETGWHRPEHTDSVISSKLQDLVREVRANPWMRKVFPYVWSHSAVDGFALKNGPRSVRVSWTGYRNAIASPQPPVPLERDALLVSHNVPTQLVRGQTYNIQMRFRNTGRWAWPKPGTFSLGFASIGNQLAQPFQITTDVDGGSVLLGVLQSGHRSLNAPLRIPVHTPVAGAPTGGEITFSFQLTVPNQSGGHQFGWALVDERPPGPDTTPDSMWFGQGLLQRVLIS